MELTTENRTVNVTAKITPSQKAQFKQKAQENDLTLSEWVCSTLEIGKDSYENACKPNQKIIELENTILGKDKLIKRLLTELENKDEFMKIKDKKIDSLIFFNNMYKDRNKDLKENAEIMKEKFSIKTPKKQNKSNFLGLDIMI